ncbi:hypothetical protein AB0H51_28255 [Streptomyces griseoluteus]|uniref:hypothetical protein n=1 Tax=Streptomyces griseoluteus TaxID=29306 RepID=UPI00340F66AF
MTSAPVAAPKAPALDADLIRRTFKGVLGESRVGTPPPAGEEQRAHTAGMLRGQVGVLLRVVGGDIDRMRGENRATAEYVMLQARCLLTYDPARSRTPDGLVDLALMARSLLTLHEIAW